ncbi:MAG: hypothetical protein EXR75_04380, partial [Myxococcales bacterium]|nr:hypothetical protein [Myxococcales bacterium]
MIAPDVRFEGFTGRDWQRVVQLFTPERTARRPRDPERAEGGVIAVHAEGRPRKLVHSSAGRLRLDDVARDWPLSAAELGRRHEASWALKLESGALESIFEQLGARLRQDDDFLAQTLILLALVRDEITRGTIESWPRRLQGIPLPTAAMVEHSLDVVCPAGRTMLLGLFDGDEVWTSVALRRGPRGIDLVLGPDALRGELGLLSGDFRRDHRHLARAVTDRASPLSFGCYAEWQTFRALEVDPSPGAWALAVAVRDLVLHPVPAALAIPLGL